MGKKPYNLGSGVYQERVLHIEYGRKRPVTKKALCNGERPFQSEEYCTIRRGCYK